MVHRHRIVGGVTSGDSRPVSGDTSGHVDSHIGTGDRGARGARVVGSDGSTNTCIDSHTIVGGGSGSCCGVVGNTNSHISWGRSGKRRGAARAKGLPSTATVSALPTAISAAAGAATAAAAGAEAPSPVATSPNTTGPRLPRWASIGISASPTAGVAAISPATGVPTPSPSSISEKWETESSPLPPTSVSEKRGSPASTCRCRCGVSS